MRRHRSVAAITGRSLQRLGRERVSRWKQRGVGAGPAQPDPRRVAHESLLVTPQLAAQRLIRRAPRRALCGLALPAPDMRCSCCCMRRVVALIWGRTDGAPALPPVYPHTAARRAPVDPRDGRRSQQLCAVHSARYYSEPMTSGRSRGVTLLAAVDAMTAVFLAANVSGRRDICVASIGRFAPAATSAFQLFGSHCAACASG